MQLAARSWRLAAPATRCVRERADFERPMLACVGSFVALDGVFQFN